MKFEALAAVFLVVASAVGATAATPQPTQVEAYTGTYVEFRTQGNAVVDYSVDGTTLVEGVAVQSKREAQSSGGLGTGIELDAVTDFSAAGLSLSAKAESGATVEAESGATMKAHDNDRGILLIRANGEDQYVRANLSGDVEAEQESEQRVVVTKRDGTQGTFIVVGDGQVTVNQDGNVTAGLGSDGTLVYRQYEGERTDSERKQEALIANGTAAAEVYVQSAAEGSANATADIVSYSEDTTVEVTERSNDAVTMTVERAEHEGRVVITSVSEQVFDSTENLEVTVDGEAAAAASSYSEIESAANGGDTSTFLVRQSSSARASTDVVVGINHFSQRTVSMSSGDGTATGGDGGNEPQSPGATDGSGPGFGVLSALAALGAALVALRRA